MPLVTTPHVSPAGTKLDNSHHTVFTFAADPDVSLWQKVTKPPGLDGGDPIDTTTHENDTVRTKAPRALQEMTDATMECAYDPAVLDQLLALLNVPGSITVLFPNNSAWNFFGYLRSFDVNDNPDDGEQPTANCVIVCTNQDPVTGAETLPDYDATGTS